MNEIKLSYVITTFNKLQYLTDTLSLLIERCGPDEEIIVSDGGSSDGSERYLKDLLDNNKIHQFVSEKDFGEAHGYNKGMLMARGEVIKLLSDDDAFSFSAIEKCKQFMLQNPQVHILNANGGWAELKLPIFIDDFTQVHQNFFTTKWLNTGHPFAHCGLGLMLRRDAIPMLGLFGVGYTRADAEYTLKISSLKINYAWYTGHVYVRILNKDSNSFNLETRIREETKKMNAFYGFDIDLIYKQELDKIAVHNNQISTFDKMVWKFKTVLKTMVHKFNNKQDEQYVTPNVSSENANFKEVLAASVTWLENKNKDTHLFLHKAQ